MSRGTQRGKLYIWLSSLEIKPLYYFCQNCTRKSGATCFFELIKIACFFLNTSPFFEKFIFPIFLANDALFYKKLRKNQKRDGVVLFFEKEAEKSNKIIKFDFLTEKYETRDYERGPTFATRANQYELERCQSRPLPVMH